jgi:hypothetical protein
MSRVIDQLKEAVRKRDQAAAQKISPPVS